MIFVIKCVVGRKRNQSQALCIKLYNESLHTLLILCPLLQIFLNICWPILYNVQREKKGDDAVEEGFEMEKDFEMENGFEMEKNYEGEESM